MQAFAWALLLLLLLLLMMLVTSLSTLVLSASQMVRAIPTTSNDRIYCKILAHNAVHAAFAGAHGSFSERGGSAWLRVRSCSALLSRQNCTAGARPTLDFSLTPPRHTHISHAGYTGLTVGLVNTHYCLLPIPVVISAPRKVCVMQ